MFYHGSPKRIEPGEILRPGATRGEYHNCPNCEHVYITTGMGVSLTEALFHDSSIEADTIDQLAIQEAGWWGRGESDVSYVHVVTPLGPLEFDPHVDVSPVCLRTTSARVEAVFEFIGRDTVDRVEDWVRSEAAAQTV